MLSPKRLFQKIRKKNRHSWDEVNDSFYVYSAQELKVALQKKEQSYGIRPASDGKGYTLETLNGRRAFRGTLCADAKTFTFDECGLQCDVNSIGMHLENMVAWTVNRVSNAERQLAQQNRDFVYDVHFNKAQPFPNVIVTYLCSNRLVSFNAKIKDKNSITIRPQGKEFDLTRKQFLSFIGAVAKFDIQLEHDSRGVSQFTLVNTQQGLKICTSVYCEQQEKYRGIEMKIETDGSLSFTEPSQGKKIVLRHPHELNDLRGTIKQQLGLINYTYLPQRQLHKANDDYATLVLPNRTLPKLPQCESKYTESAPFMGELRQVLMAQ